MPISFTILMITIYFLVKIHVIFFKILFLLILTGLITFITYNYFYVLIFFYTR